MYVFSKWIIILMRLYMRIIDYTREDLKRNKMSVKNKYIYCFLIQHKHNDIHKHNDGNLHRCRS